MTVDVFVMFDINCPTKRTMAAVVTRRIKLPADSTIVGPCSMHGTLGVLLCLKTKDIDGYEVALQALDDPILLCTRIKLRKQPVAIHTMGDGHVAACFSDETGSAYIEYYSIDGVLRKVASMPAGFDIRRVAAPTSGSWIALSGSTPSRIMVGDIMSGAFVVLETVGAVRDMSVASDNLTVLCDKSLFNVCVPADPTGATGRGIIFDTPHPHVKQWMPMTDDGDFLALSCDEQSDAASIAKLHAPTDGPTTVTTVTPVHVEGGVAYAEAVGRGIFCVASRQSTLYLVSPTSVIRLEPDMLGVDASDITELVQLVSHDNVVVAVYARCLVVIQL